MGNILRGDDGFGVEVARKLRAESLPEKVDVIEVGIAGLSIVQRLLDGYDKLIMIDTTKRGGRPGTIYVLEPEVPKVAFETLDVKLLNYLADEHYVEPSKVLALANGLGILPKKVLIVGCEPAIHEEVRIGLTRSVREAARKAVGLVLELVAQEIAG